MANALIGFLIVGGIIFLGVVGLLFWWFYTKSKYRFIFRVWARDLSNSYIIRARISIDKENKNKRVFTFKNNPSTLVMRDPQHWTKGKPERWVIPDESGEYQYLSPVSKPYTKEIIDKTTGKSSIKAVDDTRYLQTRLHPVDRQLALEAFRNNQKRYELSDKVALATFLSLLGLTAILILGMIYGLSVVTKNAKAVGDSSHDLKDTANAFTSGSNKFMEGMIILTENLGYLYSQIGGNATIMRPVGGVVPE